MPKKLTTEEFITKAREVHGDYYDYSLTIYKTAREKVEIQCPKHGRFNQVPYVHTRGNGCDKCGRQKLADLFKGSTKDFIKKAVKLHGLKYDYSKIDYIRSWDKVIIICPEHGEFLETPNKHLRPGGCSICNLKARDEKQTYSTEEFISKAQEVHGDYYSYGKTSYVKSNINVIITCQIHGDFEQLPAGHLQGTGCNDCAVIKNSEAQKLTKEEFIQRSNQIHDYKFDYSKVVYENANSYVTIICPEHGSFPQVPSSHLTGNGCGKCSGNVKFTHSEFLERGKEVHGDTYDYSKAEYKGVGNNINIICRVHGIFRQTPDMHINRTAGCPRCYNKNEGRIAIYLNENGVVHRQFKIENRFYDFYLPDYNLIIERDGEQHYREFSRFAKSQKEEHQNDIYKTELAKKNGFKIARIPYWLKVEEEKLEIKNILNGKPTYPETPDLNHEKSKHRPK